MLKRLSVFATAQAADGTVYANVPAGQGYVCIVPLTVNRWVCLQTLPDGTATPTGWIADISLDAEGNKADIATASLSNAQRNAVSTWLTNQGIDTTGLTSAINTRAKLLWWLLKKHHYWTDLTLADAWALLRDGYEVGE